MNPNYRSSQSRRPQPMDDPFGYSIWTAEIATMDHAATNIAYLVDRAISKIIAGFDWLAEGIEKLRAACPIEVEPVKIARPAQADQANAPADRFAA